MSPFETDSLLKYLKIVFSCTFFFANERTKSEDSVLCTKCSYCTSSRLVEEVREVGGTPVNPNHCVQIPWARQERDVANARLQDTDNMRDHLRLHAKNADRAIVGGLSRARAWARDSTN